MNERLQALLAGMLDLPPGEIFPEMRRADTEAWDSLTHLQLITAIESEFGASLSMEEIANLQTPGELQRAIDAQAQSGPSA